MIFVSDLLLCFQVIPNTVLMVVGNKCDLEYARVVSTEQGQSFAGEHDCKFMETSASDNINVNEVRNYTLLRTYRFPA